MNKGFIKKTVLLAIVMVLLATTSVVSVIVMTGKEGPQGPQGPQGIEGVAGETGKDGKSAYELAVDNGYTGTLSEWLESLVGENGKDGQNGINGKSAYELAVGKGYTGTEEEWLKSLVGQDGIDGTNGTNGKSAYELAVENGFEGTLADWLLSLVGAPGKDGIDGKPGADGEDGKDGREVEFQVANGYIQWKYNTDTEWKNLVSLDTLVGTPGKDGVDGKPGADGEDGKDGREVEFQVAAGYIQWKYNTDTEWKNLVSLDTLVGAPGKDGVDGKPGADGEDGADGREVEFQVAAGYIQWKYNTDTEWKNLVSLDTLVGAPGKDGVDGKPGADGEDGREVEFQVANGYIQWKYDTDTEWKNLVSLDTLVGAPGKDGADGREVEFQVAAGYIQWKYDTDTEWKNLVSLDTLTGPKGEDGHTPVITIQNGNWYIDGVDTGVPATGEKGEQGDTGPQGPQGEQGVSVVNAYVNDELHLIIVLSNGTEIDAGYVGVEVAPKTFTVTFLDYDGTELKVETGIKNGEAAAAPTDPTRDGYKFIGWDKEFDNVTENLTVTAQYEEITNPTFVVQTTEAKAGDTNVTITISVVNNTKLASIGMVVNYDKSLILTGITYNQEIGGYSMPPANMNSPIELTWVSPVADVSIESFTFVTLTFTVDSDALGKLPITITYNPDDVYDMTEENINFDIINGAINVVE